MNYGRLGLGLILLVVILLVFIFDLNHYLTLEFLVQKKEVLQSRVDSQPYLSIIVFTLTYILVTAFSIPGALIMTLTAGALFGLLWGMCIVSVGSTVGATLAFVGSRYLVRSWVEARFPKQIQSINRGIKNEGVAYLFALRLIPLFPFFLVNLVMGVTRFKVVTFFWVSQLGMLAGTFVFVNAGRELSKIDDLSDITSPGLIASFVLLGVFPLIAKRIISAWRTRAALLKHKKPKQFDRNLIVIGAGAGGLVSSYIAATVKAKVTLIEKHKMGGDCLNTGCVPSKALIKIAKVAFETGRAEALGIHTGAVVVNFETVMKSVHESINRIEPHDSVGRYTKLGVECITGEAKILSPYSVYVNGQTLTTRAIIVATGARPTIPNYKGLDAIPFYTSDTIWSLTKQPKRLLILGAGPIACELAQAFNRLGSHVIILARGERVMTKEDEDVSYFVMSVLQREGVELKMQHRVDCFNVDELGRFVVCETSHGKVEIRFDEILLALGRTANTGGFGLSELGIVLNESGTVATDEYLATNIPTILACGDVAGPYQFTHMAAHQAWYASVNALFGWIKKFKVDYSTVPWVTYVDPEVARVGLNECEASKQEIAFEVTRYNFEELDRAIVEHNAQGFIKVITPLGKDTILGVTIVGQSAGELLPEFVLAMKKGIGLSGILATIHAYPTMAEANKYVAGEWKRQHAHIKLIEFVGKCLAWRRG